MRLWDKGGALDAQVVAFTVGDDPTLDLHWAFHDVIGSAAHVRTQAAAGMLSPSEAREILGGLRSILAEIEAGSFRIPYELEDIHTAIESRLHTLIGAVAGRVHTGRSRNDQVMTCLRLWMKERLLVSWQDTIALILAFVGWAERYQDLPLSGYTHLQRAMPSSYGLWAAGFAGALHSVLPLYQAAYQIVDRCPLGSAAGYGSPLPLDRKLSATFLGFADAERPVTTCQLTRGLDASALLAAMGASVGILARYAADVSLYTTAEFALLRLPDAFTTGSSIMPQKRNPDVAELLRAQGKRVQALRREIEDITAGLPSGYHRELQHTKGPLLRGVEISEAALSIGLHLVPSVIPQSQPLDPELYATAEAFRIAREENQPFREVYRQVGLAVRQGTFVPQERAAAPSPELSSLREGLLLPENPDVLRQKWRALLDPSAL